MQQLLDVQSHSWHHWRTVFRISAAKGREKVHQNRGKQFLVVFSFDLNPVVDNVRFPSKITYKEVMVQQAGIIQCKP